MEKAKKKLKLAEETSDLQTNDEKHNDRKRKLKRTSRYVQSSSEDEDNASNADALPSPEPLQKICFIIYHNKLSYTYLTVHTR